MICRLMELVSCATSGPLTVPIFYINVVSEKTTFSTKLKNNQRRERFLRGGEGQDVGNPIDTADRPRQSPEKLKLNNFN